jgi:hypothetical protein
MMISCLLQFQFYADKVRRQREPGEIKEVKMAFTSELILVI